MRQFNLGSAWSKGFAFISEHALNHAIILIGIGILVPAILQFAVLGGATGMNPMMMGQDALGAGGSLAAMAGAMIVVMIVSYVLQMGSYFGSWRIGLAREETLGGAIVYGIICAVLFLVAFALVAVVATVILGQAVGQVMQGGGGGGGGMVFMILLIVIPVLIVMAALYSVIMAAMTVGMFLMLLIMLAFGASMGAANPAFAMAGGGVVVLILMAVVALLFWLTARFSCTTSVMADRKSFNLFAGLAESWRLTGPNQFRIMAYLALLGILLGVVLVVVAMVIGVSMMGSMSGGQVPEVGIGSQIVALIVGIPFAYLTVLVPAGIYRELFEETAVAEVFA